MLLTTTYLSSFILRRLTAGRMMKGDASLDSAWATSILGVFARERYEVRVVVRLSDHSHPLTMFAIAV